MKVIDRILLNRGLKFFLDFIISVLRIFFKTETNSPRIEPRKRPLKELTDKILPWRKK